MEILRVENISKLYKLGEFGAGTLKDELVAWWDKLWGKENSLQKVTDQNEREENIRYLWALKDISLSLQKGDTVGLLGKNGAGKSTLLKIISRVTKPTTGRVYLNGSVSSLLEIGTGFDTELTGKENIYMSGAILGMHRTQINRLYEDIVEFSGLRRFIDTPVRRYSSGMYLRLGFSIAAHLQSEILILDEVLAVGDYEFRRRATNHIRELARSQRTILYVAHNLQSVRNICTHGLFLSQGRVQLKGEINRVIQLYTEGNEHSSAVYTFEKPHNHLTSKGYVKQISLLDANDSLCSEPYLDEAWKIKVELRINQDMRDFRVFLRTNTSLGILANATQVVIERVQPGDYSAIFCAKAFHLGVGTYLISVDLASVAGTFESLKEPIVLHINPPTKQNDKKFLDPQALIASPYQTDFFASKEECRVEN